MICFQHPPLHQIGSLQEMRPLATTIVVAKNREVITTLLLLKSVAKIFLAMSLLSYSNDTLLILNCWIEMMENDVSKTFIDDNLKIVVAKTFKIFQN